MDIYLKFHALCAFINLLVIVRALSVGIDSDLCKKAIPGMVILAPLMTFHILIDLISGQR